MSEGLCECGHAKFKHATGRCTGEAPIEGEKRPNPCSCQRFIPKLENLNQATAPVVTQDNIEDYED